VYPGDRGLKVVLSTEKDVCDTFKNVNASKHTALKWSSEVEDNAEQSTKIEFLRYNPGDWENKPPPPSEAAQPTKLEPYTDKVVGNWATRSVM
jgi:hypothetical protein